MTHVVVARSTAAEMIGIRMLSLDRLPAIKSSRKGAVKSQIIQIRQSFVVVFIGFPPNKLLRQINDFCKVSDIFLNGKLISVFSPLL